MASRRPQRLIFVAAVGVAGGAALWESDPTSGGLATFGVIGLWFAAMAAAVGWGLVALFDAVGWGRPPGVLRSSVASFAVSLLTAVIVVGGIPSEVRFTLSRSALEAAAASSTSQPGRIGLYDVRSIHRAGSEVRFLLRPNTAILNAPPKACVDTCDVTYRELPGGWSIESGAVP